MCRLIQVCVKKKCLISFFGGGRSINSSNKRMEGIYWSARWKSGAYSNTPFLVVTAALLQSIIPIAIGQKWSLLFNRFKSNPTATTTTTKSVNAEETVRQASRTSVTNEDHKFRILKLWLTFWSQK